MSYKAVMAKLKQHKEAQENFERRVEEVSREAGAIAGRVQKFGKEVDEDAEVLKSWAKAD